MIKQPEKVNIIELGECTPTKRGIPKFKKNSSFSKENNFYFNNMNMNLAKKISINKTNNQEITTTHDETISKFSNSQQIKHPKFIKKRFSYKNKKREREKILKLLKNNEKMKIPIGQRRSNPEKLNKDNIEDIIKNLNLENKNRKERKDFFGNDINKTNKKNFHISFKDINNNNKNKNLVEYIPIQSFKSLNIIEKNESNIKHQPFFSRCCIIF